MKKQRSTSEKKYGKSSSTDAKARIRGCNEKNRGAAALKANGGNNEQRKKSLC